jgi:DNA-binding MltR family transcriptional regulator
MRDAIKKRLVPLTDKEESNLFENNGPLSTLSSRINMGYALDIYGAKAKRDLNLLREIRNAFVHSVRQIEFDTPEVAQLCTTFYCGKQSRISRTMLHATGTFRQRRA